MRRVTIATAQREVKMFKAKLSALDKVQVTPLSRLKQAASLLLRIQWYAFRLRMRTLYLRLTERNECPRCFGEGIAVHMRELRGEASATPMLCQLCDGKGDIGWIERESLRYGRALLDYRLSMRCSIEGMAQAVALGACVSVEARTIEDCEAGIVPLEDWPQMLFNIADWQLDREAANHPSTT